MQTKILVDEGSEFYTRSMKSENSEGKYVIAERFSGTLKNKIDKYMTAVSKNMYIDKLDNTVNRFNNIYHIATKMKPIDVKSSTYIDFNKENNEK